MQAVWIGTKAVMLHDGAKRNSEQFLEIFLDVMDFSEERRKAIKGVCDKIYFKVRQANIF